MKTNELENRTEGSFEIQEWRENGIAGPSREVSQRGVKEKGGKVYRIGIVRSHRNRYTIKIRCSTKKAAEHYDQSRNTDQLHTTVQLQDKEQSWNMDQTNTTGSSKCGDGL